MLTLAAQSNRNMALSSYRTDVERDSASESGRNRPAREGAIVEEKAASPSTVRLGGEARKGPVAREHRLRGVTDGVAPLAQRSLCLRPLHAAALDDLAGTAVIHPPTGDCEADVVGICCLLIGGVRSGEPECSVVGDQHLP